MNQSQFLAILCNSLQAREKSRVHGAIGFGFASHWLKNWRESFKPITKRSNRDHVITFDSHLKTALLERFSIAFTANGKRQAEISHLPKTCDIYLVSAYILLVTHSYGASTKNRERS